MELTGQIKIFINEKTNDKGELFRTYSTSVGNKDQEGNYYNAYLNVRFAKDNFPEEKLLKMDKSKYYDLEIEEGFLSAEKGKDGIIRPIVVIKAGKCVAGHPVAQKAKPKKVVKTAKDLEIKDEDLPF